MIENHRQGWDWIISIPTETGRAVAVGVSYDDSSNSYTIRFSGELAATSPEGLTAAIQMAMLEVRETAHARPGVPGLAGYFNARNRSRPLVT